MPRGTELTDTQQAQLLALKAAGWSVAKMARYVNKSRKCVSNFLKSPSAYKTKKRTGRKPRMSDTKTRLMFREARKGGKNSSQLVSSLNLPVGKKRVQAMLLTDASLEWRRPMKGPWLTPIHISRRLEWATERVGMGQDYWDQIIWSDEKKWNLDGPDGLSSYWHDLRAEQKIFSKRAFGGGSVMIWACFSSKGLSNIAFITGKQNALNYCETLANNLLPFKNAHHPENCIFMQDGASIHTAHVTQNWLNQRNIPVLQWPARSPDLNPIENLWGILARRVYGGGRQFGTKDELIARIEEVWGEVEPELLLNLARSLPNRIAEVLRKQGKQTKY